MALSKLVSGPYADRSPVAPPDVRTRCSSAKNASAADFSYDFVPAIAHL